MTGARDLAITDNAVKHRFEADLGDESMAIALYELGPGKIVFTHTKVPPEHEGQGVGSALIRFALQSARAGGLTRSCRSAPSSPPFSGGIPRNRICSIPPTVSPDRRITCALPAIAFSESNLGQGSSSADRSPERIQKSLHRHDRAFRRLWQSAVRSARAAVAKRQRGSRRPRALRPLFEAYGPCCRT